MRQTVALAATLLLATTVAFAAAPVPRKLLSPPGKSGILDNATAVTVTYHRPYIRNPKPPHRPRLIFGAGSKYLVPFGQVWRLGANQATTLTTTGPITLAGVHLAAGSYTLFAIPNANHWILIISKKTGEWGIPYPGSPFDLARAQLFVYTTRATVDPFSISFEPSGPQTWLMKFAWAQTVAIAPLSVP